MRFETEPGYQAHVDFGEFQFDRADGTTGKIYLFSMILGFSRKIYAEFVERCDLPTFLDCHITASYFSIPISTRTLRSFSRFSGDREPTGWMAGPASMPIMLSASLMTAGKVPRPKAILSGASRN